MKCYLSIDTEATGLEEKDQLIQLALVPVNITEKRVMTELGWETLVKCPSFEELKPNLNEWVIKHNESLIRDAHTKGIEIPALRTALKAYLNRPEIKTLFKTEKDDRPVILGKSLSALDIPLLKRTLGWDLMNELFHHHSLDVTCVARFLVDSGKLPEGCQSTSKILPHYGIRGDANHTALSDAVDMGNVYLKMLC